MEMGPNGARWVYVDDRFTIVVRVATSLDAPVCRLTVDVERGGPVELLVTHNSSWAGTSTTRRAK